VIARVAVQTGIPPREILALEDDPEMWAALVTAVAERWPPEAEIAAQTAELTHAHLWAFVQANSGKRRVPYEPLKIVRPGAREEEPEEVPVVSLSELASIAQTGSAQLREVSER
jgi:hypothetical protein